MTTLIFLLLIELGFALVMHDMTQEAVNDQVRA